MIKKKNLECKMLHLFSFGFYEFYIFLLKQKDFHDSFLRHNVLLFWLFAVFGICKPCDLNDEG